MLQKACLRTVLVVYSSTFPLFSCRGRVYDWPPYIPTLLPPCKTYYVTYFPCYLFLVLPLYAYFLKKQQRRKRRRQ